HSPGKGHGHTGCRNPGAEGAGGEWSRRDARVLAGRRAAHEHLAAPRLSGRTERLLRVDLPAHQPWAPNLLVQESTVVDIHSQQGPRRRRRLESGTHAHSRGRAHRGSQLREQETRPPCPPSVGISPRPPATITRPPPRT